MKIEIPSKHYHSADHSVYSCQYHVIFCPKYRRAVLVDEINTRLRGLILEKQQDYGYEVLDMDILPDHVHLVLDTDPKVGIYKIVNKIKGYTSRTLRAEFKSLRSRLPTLWTRSKFISSVGTVTLEVVKRYIEEQKGL